MRHEAKLAAEFALTKYSLFKDFIKDSYYRRYSRERYIYRVNNTDDSMFCQECSGIGIWVEFVLEGSGPTEECGWCEGTGKIIKWRRGQWLLYKREAFKYDVVKSK